ncbi:MAG: pseudouridine synthase [Myxococcales bacterium]|nr:pseudouridine synthase [Myxococcales bacterium]
MTTLLFNKPFRVLTRFTDEDGRRSLADYVSTPGVYPAGRLDRDSEGLVLLTDDGRVQHRVSHPRAKLPKTYWAQVEGLIDADALAALRAGVELKDGLTAPAEARSIAAPAVWDRDPPIRVRKSVPTSWIELTLREGRNRQVRRMTAEVGFPTLRLIRVRIGPWALDGLAPGAWRVVDGRPLEIIARYLERRSRSAGDAEDARGVKFVTRPSRRRGRGAHGRQAESPDKRRTRG